MNSIIKNYFILIFIALSFIGCAHSLHLAQVSDFSPTYKSIDKGQLIKAESEQFAVLGFVTDTNYVDEAVIRLQNQCLNGQIQGITTQFSTSLGFFSWVNHIQLQGLCIK